MTRVVFAVVLCVAASVTFPAAAQVLSFLGVGPVRLGMSVAEAERSLQARLAPLSLPFSERCWITQRADGKDPLVTYTIEDGKIVRIDILESKDSPSKLKDTYGIGVGSDVADIRLAYGKSETVRDPYYDEKSETEAAKERTRLGVKSMEPAPHFWVRVDSPNHARAIVFETSDSKVVGLRTGFQGPVGEMEICR